MPTTIEIPIQRETSRLLGGTFDRDTYELRIRLASDSPNAEELEPAEFFVDWDRVRRDDKVVVEPLGGRSRSLDDELQAANRYAIPALDFIARALAHGPVERLALQGSIVNMVQILVYFSIVRSCPGDTPEDALSLFSLATFSELLDIARDEFGMNAPDYTSACQFLNQQAQFGFKRSWTIGDDDDQRAERRVYEIVADTGLPCGSFAERALEVIRAGYVLGDPVRELVRRAYHEGAEAIRPLGLDASL